MAENRVSISLTPEQNQQIVAAISQLTSALTPICVSLTAEERQRLLKMGPASVAFVAAAGMHAQQHPEFVPSFVDVPEFLKDVKTVEDFTKLENLLGPVMQLLTDTMLLAGSEAYNSGLMVYGNIQSAAKNRVAGAESILNDLKGKLPQAKSRKKAEPQIAA